MSPKKQGAVSLAACMALVVLGILLKRVWHCVPGLYVCHVLGGSALLLSAVSFGLPEGMPAVRRVPQEPAGENPI